MRSYSSLLCHILGSNPEIDGYSEIHQPYRDIRDLFKLRLRVYERNNNLLEGNYILDKILHNYHISDSVLTKPSLNVIFVLRKPHDSVKSILGMAIQQNNERFNTAEKTSRYYVERLERMEQHFSKLNSVALFLEAERLIEDSTTVLGAISARLNLRAGLKSSYSIFKYTGHPQHGDPSDYITRGKIITTKKDHSRTHIPQHLLLRAEEAYERCCSALLRGCVAI